MARRVRVFEMPPMLGDAIAKALKARAEGTELPGELGALIAGMKAEGWPEQPDGGGYECIPPGIHEAAMAQVLKDIDEGKDADTDGGEADADQCDS